MTMRILRDLKESTKVLILLEITTGRHTRLKTISDKLGMTVQGVSEYLKAMTREGLAARIRGEYRATTKGVELLHQDFLAIKGFVDESMKKLAIVDVCTALAGSDLREGDRVGLFMEDGLLRAYPGRRSSSKGMAASDARKGEDVGIRALEGIVALRPGRLWAVELPDIKSGGSQAVPGRAARALMAKARPRKLAALDLGAHALLRRMGLKCDIEFAPVESSLEALLRGLDVLALGSGAEVDRLIARVKESNASSPRKVEYAVTALG